MTYLGLALLPAAYLARAATRTAADTHPASRVANAPRARFNWTIAMVVAAVALLVGAAALDRGDEKTRDPNAVVPDIVGMSLPEANDALDRLDLDIATYDATGDDRQVWIESNWIVAEQKPPAGTKLGDLSEVEAGVVKRGESQATTAPPTPATTTLPPTRDACRMIDPDALAAAKMSARLQPPRQSAPSGADDTPIYGCANDLDEVTLEVHLYPTHEAARANAEYATRQENHHRPLLPLRERHTNPVRVVLRRRQGHLHRYRGVTSELVGGPLSPGAGDQFGPGHPAPHPAPPLRRPRHTDRHHLPASQRCPRR